jgi:hypothetical protein
VSFDSEIVDYLSTELGHDHIYPDSLVEGATLPAVVYQRISTARVRSHDGTSLVGPLYQFACWATTPLAARALARQVIEAWEARMGYALVENDRDMPAPSPKLFRRDVDVRLWDGLDADLNAVS